MARRRLLAALFAATAVIATMLPARPLLAAGPLDLVVKSSDDGTTAGHPCPGDNCTLRSAIETSIGKTSKITLRVSGPIQLGSPLTINGTQTVLEIVGDPKNKTVIDGHDEVRIFELTQAKVTLSNLILQKGAGEGGGAMLVNDSANVTFRDGIIKDNHAFFDGGGGVLVIGDANLTLSQSVISGNHADDGAGRPGRVSGGGVLMRGHADVTIDESTVTDNHATEAGGGIELQGATNHSKLTIRKSTVSKNTITSTCSAHGGGIHVGANQPSVSSAPQAEQTSLLASLAISDSTVSDNTVEVSVSPGVESTCKSIVEGGGVSLSGDRVAAAVTRSTLARNHAKPFGLGKGGGFSNHALSSSAEITNSTISENDADQGGGVWNGNQSTVNLKNDTVANNAADQGFGIFAEKAPATSGVPVAQSGKVTLKNTVVANKSDNCFGSVTSLSNNVTTDDSCGAATVLDPKLSALDDYGGPTRTHALLPGSLAKDKGDNKTCQELESQTDQRGRPRFPGSDGVCDIGAFEVQPPTITIDPVCPPPNAGGDTYSILVKGSDFISPTVNLLFAGEQVTTAPVTRQTGTFEMTIKPPKRSAGTYEVRANGVPEAESARANGVPETESATALFREPCPNIKLTPPACDSVGSDAEKYQIGVHGGDFAPGSVELSFAGAPAGKVTVDKSGELNTTISPNKRSAGTYPVKAVDSNGGIATANFRVPCLPTPTIKLDQTCGPATSGAAGETYSITVTGRDFQDRNVNLVFANQPPVPVDVGPDGQFSRTITPPRQPANGYQVEVKGESGTVLAKAPFGVPCPPPPAITISPSCALAAGGTDTYSITVEGTGFAPGQASITFAGKPAGSGPVDAQGSFQIPITAPNQPAGKYPVKAVDGDGTDSADFIVPCSSQPTPTPTATPTPTTTPTPTPTTTPSSTATPAPPCGSTGAPACSKPKLVITPTAGPAGFTTSVIGSGFPANSTVSLRWDRGLTPSDLDRVVTDGSGSFTVPILIFPHDALGPRKLRATPAPGASGFAAVEAGYLVVPGSAQPPEITVGSGDGGDAIVLRR